MTTPERYSTRLYHVTLPSGHEFTERAIGPSIICAHYPQLVALRLVREVPKLTPDEAAEATREGSFW